MGAGRMSDMLLWASAGSQDLISSLLAVFEDPAAHGPFGAHAGS